MLDKLKNFDFDNANNVFLYMPDESYKKWIVIGIIAFLAIVVFFVVMTTEDPYKSEQTARKPARSMSPPAGPLVDVNPNRIAPLEQIIADSNDPESLSAVGDKYFESGNYEKAIQAYKKVLELDPKHIDTYNDLGLAYHYTRRSMLAIDILKKGSEVMPSYQRIWLSLGYVSVSTDNVELGRTALAKAVELDPESIMGQEAKKMLSALK